MLVNCELFWAYGITIRNSSKDLVTLLNFNLVDKDQLKVHLGWGIGVGLLGVEGLAHFNFHFIMTHMRMTLLATQ
jgi:hypothetical protein